jgi:hypothetical protein
MNKELKHISLDAKSFKANGNEYFIKNTLNIKRFREWEKLENHFAFGKSFKEIYDDLKNCVEFANKGKTIEAWNIILNLMEGIGSKLEDKQHPALLACTLFMVTKDEDLTQWDESFAEQKISDWEKEGIAMADFFRFSANFATDFIPIYEEISQNTLMEKVKKELDSIKKDV